MSNSATTSFQAWLAEAIGRRLVSKAALAREVGVHPSTVGRWLAGRTRPDPGVLLRIAHAFGESPITLFHISGLGEFRADHPAETADEAALLTYFRSVDEAHRELILAMARETSSIASGRSPRKRRP